MSPHLLLPSGLLPSNSHASPLLPFKSSKPFRRDPAAALAAGVPRPQLLAALTAEARALTALSGPTHDAAAEAAAAVPPARPAAGALGPTAADAARRAARLSLALRDYESALALLSAAPSAPGPPAAAAAAADAATAAAVALEFALFCSGLLRDQGGTGVPESASQGQGGAAGAQAAAAALDDAARGVVEGRGGLAAMVVENLLRVGRGLCGVSCVGCAGG
jgi:hypothetical protein